ncbi:MAG TPA: choice-of-anchor tandem repeat GloVer-containing protein [Candidatus Sulfotelmatobacter sp.]|nr:choice-of-anchor tandem repeat GloVer-containing protein [Candidatus Sulfotelmatobacter sp.]
MKDVSIRGLLTWAMLVFATTVVRAQSISVYNFGSKSGDPANPSFSGIIAQGRDGRLYSTTPSGGASGAGAIFRITPTGALTVLYSFTGGTDGAYPSSGLTLGTDGNFYGTTLGGGVNYDGTVFKVTSGGSLTVLHSFNCTDGCEPVAGVIQGADGNLYGTTFAADGTVFKISPTGVFNTLHSFQYFDGAGPNAPLVQGIDGSFYGTTDSGGMYGYGTVFKITSAGSFNVLHNFTCGDDGCVPVDGLVQGTDGSFYGTTREGGANGDGSVFKMTPGGTVTTLYTFSGPDGAAPFGGLARGTDGNFYGTTSSGGTLNDGTIFRMSPSGSYSVVYNFDGTTGSTPYVTPTQHTNGVIYGDTLQGGTGNVSPCTTGSCGVFYGLNAHLRAYVSMLPNAGKVGSTVEFLGQNFTSTTTVSFNGLLATSSVKSSTYVTAIVPSGATTGFVTVTTSKGTLKSNKKFRVIP